MAPADDATFFVRALLACGSDLTIADRVLAALDKHPHLITEHSGHTESACYLLNVCRVIN